MGHIVLSIQHCIVAATVVILSLLIIGCSSPTPGSPEAVEKTVHETPDWFLKVPSNQSSVYAVGTAASFDLQLAMDKAVLSAKRSLADRIRSILSSEMREFVVEVSQGDDKEIIAEVERVTSNLITEVDVGGYNQADAKIISQSDKYRAYVLLQYPISNIRLIALKNERDLLNIVNQSLGNKISP